MCSIRRSVQEPAGAEKGSIPARGAAGVDDMPFAGANAIGTPAEERKPTV